MRHKTISDRGDLGTHWKIFKNPSNPTIAAHVYDQTNLDASCEITTRRVVSVRKGNRRAAPRHAQQTCRRSAHC